MSDTCGLTSCEPFAKWDRDSQSWKTSEATCLWALTLSSLTLPAWGGLHDGELCEHPTPERLTSGPAFSSLPTPAAMLGASDVDFQVSGDGRTKPNKLGWAIGEMLPTPTVDDASNITRASGCYNSLTRTATMLPTPRATDGPKGGPGQVNGRGVPDSLPAISALLPTPAVNDMGEGKTLEWWDEWAPRQKSSDGRPAPHGRSLAIEAQRLLPTPTSQAAKHGETPDTTANGYGSNLWDLPSLLPTPTSRDHKGANQRGDATCLHGAITAPPLSDGSASSDDPLPGQLSLDGLALPA